MRQQGFTYLGLLILVAIIGLVGAAGLKVGSLLQRAAAEEELLEIGAEFSRALKSYADATPRGHPTFPATLNELLRDPRVPGVRRHLRKIHVDPITGKAEWGLVTMGENAGVLGVYSLSDAKPLKVSNFDARFTGFENKKKISEWKFMLPGQTLLPNGAVNPGAPGAGGPQPGTSPRGALSSLFGAQRGQFPGAQAGQAPATQPQPQPQPQPAPQPQPVPPPAPADPEPPQEVTPPAPEPDKAEEEKEKEAEKEAEKDEEGGKEQQDERGDSGGVRGNRAR